MAVSLRNVTFRYPGAVQSALDELSLEIPAGSFVGVTSPVGSGKSAFARALLGVYPIATGSVLMDGRAVESLSRDERAGLLGYLPQDAHLFSGTIRENVLLGRAEPDAVSVDRLVDIVALREDVATFPEGLETQIGELGVRISGGQRQRVGLARAISAGSPGLPGLLVLDDPFSAVDLETETLIVGALREAFGPNRPEGEQVTIVLCSHRLAAFPRADLVVVLEHGRIREVGRHDDLMAHDDLYALIYNAQQRVEDRLVVEQL